ncbi:MAG TPA: ABC transporter ATP-binding protein [Actinocrinis sp.]
MSTATGPGALGATPSTSLLEPVLAVENLTVDFPTPDGVVRAVRGVSYQLGGGEVLGIVGESGSGKSVTSMAVMGLLPRTARVSGSVRFRGRELIGLNDKQMTEVRGQKIAMIFQDPMTSLNPVYKIGYQLAEAVLAHRRISRAEAQKRAVELLDLVGIPFPQRRIDQYPHEFSGGMRQRVVIAIAMANDPDVIIADEPTTALDVTVQAQVLEALRAAQAETGAATVLITHDLGVIAGQADRVLVMYAGKPVEIGSVDDIYYAPRMPYTLGLLGSLPRLDVRKQERLTPIQGAPPSLVNLPPGCPFTPRCPMAQDRCETAEPELRSVGSATHLAACHYSDQLADREKAAEVFAHSAADSRLPTEFGAEPPPETLGAPAEVLAEDNVIDGAQGEGPRQGEGGVR